MSRLLFGILAMTIVTVFTRAIPFIVFSKRDPPKLLIFLEAYLPPVLMTILVLSTFKSFKIDEAYSQIPALAGIIISGALHFWRRNVLLSIAGGTVLFMLLSRLL